MYVLYIHGFHDSCCGPPPFLYSAPSAPESWTCHGVWNQSLLQAHAIQIVLFRISICMGGSLNSRTKKQNAPIWTLALPLAASHTLKITSHLFWFGSWSPLKYPTTSLELQEQLFPAHPTKTTPPATEVSNADSTVLGVDQTYAAPQHGWRSIAFNAWEIFAIFGGLRIDSN